VVNGVNIRVYRVADMQMQNGLMRFDLAEEFVGAVQDWPEHINISKENFARLAKELLAHAINTDVEYAVNSSVNNDGSILFEGLSRGLYLIAQNSSSGSHNILPALMSIPHYDGGEWVYDAIAKPKTEPNGSTSPPTPAPTNRPNRPAPDPEAPTQPPTLTRLPPGEPVIRDDDIGYTDFDTDTPLGEVHYDTDKPEEEEEKDEDIDFSEDMPMGDLPQTGVVRWPIPILYTIGGTATLSGLFVLNKERKKDE
jgi:hypothetical protein